ncbi:hypothetical protein BT96DRAFT_767230, partial [Gymnopus androsaceus JB14]
GISLSDDDMSAVRVHNLKVEIDMGGRAYEKMCRAFPSLSTLLSLQQLQTRVAYLSGIKPVNYDCCVKSCCCYTGPHAELTACPWCAEPRYHPNGHPRNVFAYLPLIPRLVNMFLDKDMCTKMRYRADYTHHEDAVEDVFDSEHYIHLLRTKVTVGDDTLPHKFFEFFTDIALGISTDGFGVFK